MSDFHSPYMGWIVPQPWQEEEDYDPDTADQIFDERQDDSDYDDEGEFTLR
jgi:hypothetical protein